MDQERFDIDTGAPALVTGATGYVAGWIVKGLLDAGMTVHATVRDAGDERKRAHLDRLAADAPGTIRYFEADLLGADAFAEAMQGCRTVFHTASPFTSNAKDPQAELVDPARLGTRNVLEEACRQASVRRVVLTSSCAAIYTDSQDTLDAPGGRITEEVWNTTASLDYQPYAYSKTMAEKEAWVIAKGQDRWDLVAINPSLVIGPALQDRPSSESFNIMKMFGNGTFRFGVPNLGIGCVDVRDVAEAHLAAAFLPRARGRHIVSAHETTFLEMAGVLAERYGDSHPLPTRPVPKFVLKAVGPLMGLERKFIERSVDVPWRADNSKAIRELGLDYLPMKTSLDDMFEHMIETGMIAKR